MAKINTDQINGITVRYVDAQNGIKLYLLPCVPMDAGKIEKEHDFDLEGAIGKFPNELRQKARSIGERYIGRQLDAMSILLYANEREKFDEYAKKLEEKIKDFDYIHPELRLARTDVSAFFFRLYADLGIAPSEEAERAERQLRDYGPAVVVFPK